jgi:uncharacterized protein YdhG (YjbR/CyaY superfamily)
MKTEFRNTDDYIAMFPEATRLKLEEIRSIIRHAAPGAEEFISYQMPAFKLNGALVWFAGYKNHIGFYPSSSGIENFKNEFTEYKFSKGAVQFPLDKPLPSDLITRIVKFRINENIEKEALKTNEKKKKK